MSTDSDRYLPTRLPLPAGPWATDFWQLVDSQTSASINLEECPTDCSVHDGWARERAGGACLALTSHGQRCAQWAPASFPFCDRYHGKSAGVAFATHLVSSLKHHQRPWMEVGAFARELLRAVDATDDQMVEAADVIAPLIEPEPALLRTTPLPERTALYRHYDADDVLLYVGIGNDPAMRFRSHAKRSPWTQFARRHEGEWFASRVEAEGAEAQAIRDEQPLFNKALAGPDRNDRVKEYLIAHEAWDLLVPDA